MEQEKYIMKRLKLPPSSHSSWQDQEEEVAFAKDISNSSGGGNRGGGGSCIWPRRSYMCSFCRRYFRSAQALGGHMNVHRKDRALLKQVPLLGHPLHFSQPSSHHFIDQNAQDDHKNIFKTSQNSFLRANDNNIVSGKEKVNSGHDDDDVREEKLSSKRRCKKSSDDGHVKLLPLVFHEVKCSNFRGNCDLISSHLMEGVDLELRLGDPSNNKVIN